jgi:hypothetical protein
MFFEPTSITAFNYSGGIMTAVTKTKDYLRMVVGIGLIWSICMTGRLPSISFLQIATILVTLIMLWVAASGYRWLIKKIDSLYLFPIF